MEYFDEIVEPDVLMFFKRPSSNGEIARKGCVDSSHENSFYYS